MKTKQFARKKQGRITVGLVAATPGEAAPLVRSLGLSRVPCPGILCFGGTWAAADIRLAVSGIGKANAAHACGLLLREFSPRMIISFGVGGAYPGSGLAVGDVAVATAEVYADEGVILKDGFRTLRTIGIPTAAVGRRKFFNEFPLDRSLAGKALGAARRQGNAAAGVFATVSSCSGTRELALERGSRWMAICENMEGAAVAHISRLHGVPMAEVRGISNIVEDRDRKKWDIPLAVESACGVVLDLISHVAGRPAGIR